MIIDSQGDLPALLSRSPVRVVFGPGELRQIGDLCKVEGASRVLLVTDPGIVAAGHAGRARDALETAGLSVVMFDGARENPTTEHVTSGLAIARNERIDLIVGVGGGSAMDCAKGINLLLTNGGQVQDYWGEGKTIEPMLPMVVAPTTAGTGSEAQSFALITDPRTHQKMACGDRRPPTEGGLRPRVAILDPELTGSQPRLVAAASAIDAVGHAVETAGTNARTECSRSFSRAAWQRLEPAFDRALRDPTDETARADMLLGAHLAGAAIERSMLGAAHACANPLTSRFGITHGIGVGIMLPVVVRFNSQTGANPYADFRNDATVLADRLEAMLAVGGLPRRLSECGVTESALDELAAMAETQWTAKFNPRPVAHSDFIELYRAALNE